ncbi:MAG: phage tail tape measure protein, partial [Ruminococcus sp.]|nr:phage tail tape measure protein [Ruminococcus sp.]
MKLDPTNTELLSQKQKLLSEAVKDTKDRLDSLKTASAEAAKTKDNYDAWKEKITPLQTEITKTTDELNKLKKQSKEASEQLSKGEISQEEYDKIQREIKETGDRLEELKKSKEEVDKEFGHPVSSEQFDAIQREIIETEQDLQRLQNEANNSREALVKIGKVGENLQNVGGKISGVGQSLLPVTAGITAVGGAIVKTGAEFDAEMSKVSAISGKIKDEDLPGIIKSAEDMGLAFEEGATSTEITMNILRAKAREMGSETKFSATEAAQGFEYMAMAGWGAEDMLGGIDGVMNLAAASGEELGTTSDIVTDALTALRMEAKDAGHFADILAAASSNANTNVSILGESFKYCAPLAGAMKARAEDLAVALGLMANAGIKGSQAGTTLNNALTELLKNQNGEKLAAMQRLGFVETEQVIEVDNSKVLKAQTKLENQTNNLTKAQISYNEAVEQYGEESVKAQKAALNVDTMKNNVELAQAELESAMQGEVKEIAVGANVFVNEDGSIKKLGEITDILREKMKAVNVDVVDSEGNLREYDDIISELSETEEGLTQVQQLQDAAIIFGKRNLSGMLAIINASEKDYNKLTEAVNDCDGISQQMADTMNDNLLGQLTILKSQLGELAIQFSDILTPIIRDIVGKIQLLIDKLNAMSPQTKETIAKIAAFAAVFPVLLITVGKTILGIGKFMTFISKIPAILTKLKSAFHAVTAAISGISGPVAIAVAIIGILVAAFVNLWKNNEDFRNNITAIWENIKQIFTDFTQGIVDRLNALGFDFENITEVLKAAWDGLCKFLKPIFEGVFQEIADIFKLVTDVILNVFDIFAGIFTGDWDSVWNRIKNIFVDIWDFIKSTFENVMNILCDIFGTNLETVKTFWTDVWNSIKDFFVNIWNDFQDNFQTGMDIIKNTFTSVWTAIKNFFMNIWTSITNFITNVFNSIKSFFTTIWTSIKNFFIGIWTAIYNDISTKIQFIRNIIITVWNAIYSTIKPLLDAFKYLFETIFEAIKILIGMAMDWVSNKIQIIWNAIKEFITPILESIRDFFENIWNDIKTNISEKLDAIKFIVSNVWEGIKSTVSNILNSIKSVVSNVWN